MGVNVWVSFQMVGQDIQFNLYRWLPSHICLIQINSIIFLKRCNTSRKDNNEKQNRSGWFTLQSSQSYRLSLCNSRAGWKPLFILGLVCHHSLSGCWFTSWARYGLASTSPGRVFCLANLLKADFPLDASLLKRGVFIYGFGPQQSGPHLKEGRGRGVKGNYCHVTVGQNYGDLH